MYLPGDKPPIKGYYAHLRHSLKFKKDPGGGFYARHLIIILLRVIIGAIMYILLTCSRQQHSPEPKEISAAGGASAKSQILNKSQNITGR